MKSVTHRTFFSGITAAVGGLLFDRYAKTEQLRIKRLNPLGNTGIETSDIIFGAGIVHTPALVRYVFDCVVLSMNMWLFQEKTLLTKNNLFHLKLFL